jgi:cysteinyl-tRNA synthetase
MSWKRLISDFAGKITCEAADTNVFDIHGGGIDLVFPHHENEIAQSCCALDAPRMANVWMHNGFLQVEGEKMSKSLGNFVTIRELLEQFHGNVVRLTMLKTHYRQPLDWSAKEARESEREIFEWGNLIYEQAADHSISGEDKTLVDEFVIEALCDDLNTSAAITAIRKLAASAKTDRSQTKKLYATLCWLGFRDLNKPGYFASKLTSYSPYIVKSEGFITAIKYRNLVANNFILDSEKLAANVKEGGVLLSISDDGRVDVDGGNSESAEIEALINARLAARVAKNWAEADSIRDVLSAKGFAIKRDYKDPKTGELRTELEVRR